MLSSLSIVPKPVSFGAPAIFGPPLSFQRTSTRSSSNLVVMLTLPSGTESDPYLVADRKSLERNGFRAGASLYRTASTCLIGQDAAHLSRAHGKEVGSILPIDLL